MCVRGHDPRRACAVVWPGVPWGMVRTKSSLICAVLGVLLGATLLSEATACKEDDDDDCASPRAVETTSQTAGGSGAGGAGGRGGTGGTGGTSVNPPDDGDCGLYQPRSMPPSPGLIDDGWHSSGARWRCLQPWCPRPARHELGGRFESLPIVGAAFAVGREENERGLGGGRRASTGRAAPPSFGPKPAGRPGSGPTLPPSLENVATCQARPPPRRRCGRGATRTRSKRCSTPRSGSSATRC
jgi:hypothetical protein